MKIITEYNLEKEYPYSLTMNVGDVYCIAENIDNEFIFVNSLDSNVFIDYLKEESPEYYRTNGFILDRGEISLNMENGILYTILKLKYSDNSDDKCIVRFKTKEDLSKMKLLNEEDAEIAISMFD